MKHLLPILCLTVALCAAAGCRSNKRSPEYRAPVAAAEAEQQTEVEAQVAEPPARRSPWSYLAFWRWFGDDDAAEEVEVEMEVEQEHEPAPSRSVWSHLAFWRWFGDDRAEEVEVEIESAAVQPQDRREAFTYVETRREKGWADYVLPWRWFSEPQPEARVAEFEEFEEVEVEIESERRRHPLAFLAFWNWFDDDDDRITEDDVLGDMSPELVTRAETKGETKIRRAKVLDVNGRSIWDDLNEIFFFDRPSRLSLYPTP